MKIWCIFRSKEISCKYQYFIKISVYYIAIIGIYYIIMASPFMHAKCKASSLIFISKRIFHLIAVRF